MHLQAGESTGPAATSEKVTSTLKTLPFGQDVPFKSISGPTYLTSQTLVQQVAYALSDKLFTYSPETFDLDVAARKWNEEQQQNAHNQVTGVQCLETRAGAGNIALGYMFSSDFDLGKRHLPQTIIASAASLLHLRPALDQLSLLYNVANPTTLQVAAVDYAPQTKAGLVTDYCTALSLSEELGLGLVTSKSAYEVQHMSLLSNLLAAVVPSIHTYDGITVGRETTRVIDVLNVASLKRIHDSVLEAVKADLASKRLTDEGKVTKLMQAFNAELGTEYKCFEYHGHAEAIGVLVVFGTVEASLAAQVAEALAQQGVKVGIINTRVYRPLVEEEFLAALPASVQKISVLGQVKDQAAALDASVSSSLYADVLAAVNFHSMASGKAPSVFDIKYARETVWTVSKVQTLLQQLGAAPGQAPQEVDLALSNKDVKQYTFWDIDGSNSATAPVMIGQLFAGNSALNVTVRSSRDNLVQGGALRTDLRTSSKSIESAYSVKDADVAVVGDLSLLKDFSVLEGRGRREEALDCRAQGDRCQARCSLDSGCFG